MEVKVNVSIDLNNRKAIVKITEYIDIPCVKRDTGERFILESDEGGYSCVERRGKKYYHVNYLRERNMFGEWIMGSEKPIYERRIRKKEAIELLRKAITRQLQNR